MAPHLSWKRRRLLWHENFQATNGNDYENNNNSDDCYDEIWYGTDDSCCFNCNGSSNTNTGSDLRYQQQPHDNNIECETTTAATSTATRNTNRAEMDVTIAVDGVDETTEYCNNNNNLNYYYYNDNENGGYYHDDEHHQEEPHRMMVRNSWLNHMQWISSSVSNSNSTQKKERNCDDNNNDDELNNGLYRDTNTNRTKNNISSLQLLQHSRHQLLLVKRRLQPAIDRYNNMSTTTTTTKIRSSHENNNSHRHRNTSGGGSNRTTNTIFHTARRDCNPYEILGEGQHHGLNQYLFMNRSAIKLVNMDAILNFTLTTGIPSTTVPNISQSRTEAVVVQPPAAPPPTTIQNNSTTNSTVFKFCDLCGAPGGFSEYLLWRFNTNNNMDNTNTNNNGTMISCRGYGMSLIGNNEHGYGLPWKLRQDAQSSSSTTTTDVELENDRKIGGGNTTTFQQNYSRTNNPRQQSSSYKICHGIDGTGDIYNWDNVVALQEMIYNDDINSHVDNDHNSNGDDGKVHLVVVDGGFDAQRDNEYQEEVSLKLVVCEAAAALSLLCNGGTLVMKMFGFQTSIVRTMMIHFYLQFDRIMVMKPISSRPASAERYVVCCGYHGHPPDWSGQRWSNDLYLGRPCSVLNHNTSDINYIEKEAHILRYIDEFDRKMYMLNLKASFAILSYIEREYLQRCIAANNTSGSDESDDTNDWDDPCNDDDYGDNDEWQPRINIPMYRIAWRLDS